MLHDSQQKCIANTEQNEVMHGIYRHSFNHDPDTQIHDCAWNFSYSNESVLACVGQLNE